VFLRLAAATGARRGELCALKWTDIDFGLGQLTISRGLVEASGRVIEKDTKTHAARRMTLGAGTVAELERHHEHCTEIARAFGADLPPDAYVFRVIPLVPSRGDPAM
jgi:integrase